MEKQEALNEMEKQEALNRPTILKVGWKEIVPDDEERDRAFEMLERFPLRGADGFQLAVALVWCGDRPAGRVFICSDVRLCEAAEAAGFSVIRPWGKSAMGKVINHGAKGKRLRWIAKPLFSF